MERLRKYSSFLIFFVLAFFPIIDYGWRRYKLPFSTIWDDLFLIAALIIALIIGFKKIRTLFNYPTFIFALLFATVSLLSFTVNTYLFIAFAHQFRLFFEPFVIFIIIVLLKPEKEEIKFYLKSLVFTMVFLALIGIYQYVKKVPTPVQWVDKSLEASSIYTRAFSIVGSPNILAAYLQFGVIISLFFLFTEEKFLTRLICAFAFFITGGGLLLTFSRGGWFAAAGSLFIGFLLFSPLLGIIAIATSGIVIGIVPVLRLRIISLLSSSYLQKSANNGRLFRWKNGVLNASYHPWLGSGLGTYGGSAGQKYGYFASTSMDSVYLNVFAETGWLGIVTFALWVSFGIGRILNKYLSKKNLIYLFIIIALLSTLIHMFVENIFDAWGIALNFWALTAIGEVFNE
jgi:putative inorganic carbon (HCO3(-)) transporter